MKVFQLHVGNKVEKKTGVPASHYLERLSFDDGKLHYYLKQDIANADIQMHSIIKKGVEIHYGHLSERKSIKNLLQAGLNLRKICSEKKIEIVHVFWGSTTSLTAVLFSPCPVIISFSGSDLLGNVDTDGKINLSGRISRFLSQLSALLASRIIVKSEQMKKVLWQLSRRKTKVIPNGVDLSAFYPMDQIIARNKTGWPPQKKIIIFFNGSNAIVKDQPLAEKVFSEVKRQISEVEFKVLNKIPHEQLVYYYNASDVMLLTSFHEGSNNSTKEARACNLPIVSVNVGDAKERLANVDNSFVVNSRNPQVLATKVIEVLKNGRRSNGADYSGDVSIDHIATEIQSVYKSIKI